MAATKSIQHSKGSIKARARGIRAGDSFCIAIPACFPSLTYSGCAFVYCGIVEALLSLCLMEMFAGGTLRPRKWEMPLVSTVWMFFDTMGTGLLYADEEIWKEF